MCLPPLTVQSGGNRLCDLVVDIQLCVGLVTYGDIAVGIVPEVIFAEECGDLGSGEGVGDGGFEFKKELAGQIRIIGFEIMTVPEIIYTSV